MWLIDVCARVSGRIVDVCRLDFVAAAVYAGVTIALALATAYVLIRCKRRWNELLLLHNLRSSLTMFLLLLNVCEIAESTLSIYTTPEGFATSHFQLLSCWFSFISSIVLVAFIRTIEVRMKEGWLCFLVPIEGILQLIKVLKLFRVMEDVDAISIQAVFHECSIACLGSLIISDLYTLYKGINHTTKRMRTASSRDKIGYKHSQATFLSKITFWWLTPLLWQGYHDPLELDDLGQLPEDETSRSHYDQFLIIYQNTKNKNISLWLCYFKSSWKMFAYGGLLKLCGDLTALVGPLSISQIVEYIEITNSSNSLNYDGWEVPYMNATIANTTNITGSASINSISNGMGNGFSNITTPTTIELAQPENKYLMNEKSQIYYPKWSDFIGNGWIMGMIVLIASLAQGSLSQASTHIVNMVGIRLRTSIQGLIYRKTLLITSSCYFRNNKIDRNNMLMDAERSPHTKVKQQRHQQQQQQQHHHHQQSHHHDQHPQHHHHQDKQNTFDAGTITNLMSEDVLNVMSFFWIAHYVWAIPLKIGVVMYFLYQMLGISAIIGAVVCVMTMIPLQFSIGKAMSTNAKTTSECTDARLKRINEVLIGIKVIKLNAWERVFKEKIQNSRNMELKYLKKDSVYWTLMTFLTHVSSVLITFVTLAIYINIESGKMEFTASRVFAALALFNQLTVPLFIFPITVPVIISAIISTRRLESFLGQPEVHRDMEGVKNMARVLSRSDASLDEYEIDDFSHPIESEESSLTFLECDEKNDVGKDDISIYDGSSGLNTFPTRKVRSSKTKLRKNNEISRATKLERNRLRQKSQSRELQISLPPDLVVKITNGLFAWENTDHNILLNVEKLHIPAGKLTIIVGKSGSGKTSLLATLLGEMVTISGHLTWNKYSTIAYVPQIPWLLNATIRENVLFGEPFRPKRYQKILELCALIPDIELMPSGDQTEIGERGINLSGGQRQRIAIARAFYSSANVVIMDDPMSSLDNEVAKWIFDNGIKKMLLRHKRTVILVTQKTHLIYGSDNIIAMDGNSVRAYGTYAEIEKTAPHLIQEWNSILAEHGKDVHQSPGRTARERWKLFKNVSKIGLQRISVSDEDTCALSTSQNLYVPKKRSSYLYDSRHLTYDMPFPIDECNTEVIEIRRRPSKRRKSCELGLLHKDVSKVNSLEMGRNRIQRSPVVRNISSPTRLQYFHNRNRRTSDISIRNSGFRKFLNRMSLRNSNCSSLNRADVVSDSISENESPTLRPISTVSNFEYPAPLASKDSEDEVCSNYNEKISNRLIYDEERKYGKIPARIYMLYLKSCGLYVVLVFCLSALGWQALRVFTDVWLRGWTDIDCSSNGDTEVFYYFRVFAILSMVCIGISMISTPAGQLAGYRACKKLHDRFLNAVISKSLNFFQTTPHGRIMNRFSSDFTVIDKKIATSSQRLLQFILLCLSAVLINAAITPWFILLTIPICGAYYMVQQFYRSSSRELQRIESITSSPVISHFSESIHGVTSIRAYSQESRFMEILFKRIEANNVAFIMLNTSNRWLGIALDYLGGVIVFVAIDTALFTSYMYPEQTTPSLVGLAINYTLLVPIYLNWVVKLLSDMEMYIGAVERIAYYIESENSYGSDRNYVAVPISWPHKGDICFENVSIRYENQTKNVITNVNLKINAGQRIGICGRTGSGKSTLAQSLFRFVDVCQGKIMIDEIDISTIHTDEIRARLSIIPQEGILFDGTIRENLDPRGHYTDLELWNSLEIAQLKDIIAAMPCQLDTIIAENGATLSAGQRQLFSLARAVLKGSVCLVLDEATSSLDTQTELALLNAASKAFQGRTVITIAHRLNTLLDYDRIIVLENGQIIEDGNPRDLVNKSDGKFAAMLNSSMTSHDT